MKRIFFFATRHDVLSIMNAVEQKNALKYYLTFHHAYPKYAASGAPVFESASRIPELGIAAGSQTGGCERYVVACASTLVEPMTRYIGLPPPGKGRFLTAYEMGNCRDCVQFNAGGFWEETVLLNGLIETWSDSASAQRLMRQFMSAIKKNFREKINLYWVGPEAFEFLKNGGRLTLNVDAASSFDLKIPE